MGETAVADALMIICKAATMTLRPALDLCFGRNSPTLVRGLTAPVCSLAQCPLRIFVDAK